MSARVFARPAGIDHATRQHRRIDLGVFNHRSVGLASVLAASTGDHRRRCFGDRAYGLLGRRGRCAAGALGLAAARRPRAWRVAVFAARRTQGAVFTDAEGAGWILGHAQGAGAFAGHAQRGNLHRLPRLGQRLVRRRRRQAGRAKLARGIQRRLLGLVLALEHPLHPRRQLFARIELARRVQRLLQVRVHLHRRLIAIGGAAAERLHHDALKLFGNAAVDRRRRQDLDVADLVQYGHVVVDGEQALAGQKLIQHDAQRENIRASVERLAAHLLGRHIRKLALGRAAFALAVRLNLGDAEVDQLDLALVADHHVRRRDVAVHQVEVVAQRVLFVVGVVQALAQLHGDQTALSQRHRRRAIDLLVLAALEGLAQRAARDVLHRQVVAVFNLAPVEHLAEVGVVELNDQLGLVDEQRDQLLVRGDHRQDAL